jgi:hypothetical protein
MLKLRPPIVAILLSLLLSACGGVGNADLGPNPGGGFYDGPNLNVGQINP